MYYDGNRIKYSDMDAERKLLLINPQSNFSTQKMLKSLEKIGKLKKDGLYVATVGYPVGMPGSTNTIKILTPSEIEYYLNFRVEK